MVIGGVGCNGGEGDESTSTTVQTTGATDGTTSPSTTDPSDGTTNPTTGPTTGSPTSDPSGSTTVEPTTTTSDDTTTDPSGSTTGTTADDTTSEGSSTGAVAATASATLEPKSGSQVTGTVLFTDAGGGSADLVIEVANVQPPGTHALHIHELPDCSAPDGNSTGNHWNPNGTMLGELGTVEIGNDGTGVFMKSDAWTIGSGGFDDVVNHSIIIHAEAGGGTRIACGVIAKD